MNIMKTYRLALWLVIIPILIIFFSCDKSQCGNWWYINKTEHKINVDVYCHGQIFQEKSFVLLPYDSLLFRTCSDMGSPPDPFTHSTCSVDSILLVFNDTLSLNTRKYLEFTPENPVYINKTTYRYEFTQAHYQKALEVNGY